jgi:hypothetical protein
MEPAGIEPATSCLPSVKPNRGDDPLDRGAVDDPSRPCDSRSARRSALDEEADGMRRQIVAAVGVVLIIGLGLATVPSPATARTTGRLSARGVIVASGASGARTVVNTLFVTRGVFAGVGRIVEVPSRPGDPENLDRDELVFPQGTMHLLTTSRQPQLSVDPQTCAVTVRISQTSRVRGGTRKFRRALGRFAGTVRGWGVAARAPDGSCSQTAPPLLEVDDITTRGTLSF